MMYSVGVVFAGWLEDGCYIRDSVLPGTIACWKASLVVVTS
jgi:hypothetical protein